MKRYYYAIFKKTSEAVEVEFPDLKGCVTFGSDWDEAYKNAIDVLAAWLAHAEHQFIQAPSLHEDLANLKGILIPIPVDKEILDSYQELKRFNVILPANVLNQIDVFRKKMGLKRSTFLQKASEEFLKTHRKASTKSKTTRKMTKGSRNLSGNNQKNCG